MGRGAGLPRPAGGLGPGSEGGGKLPRHHGGCGPGGLGAARWAAAVVVRTHLAPLELEEAVEIAGAERGAQLRGALGVAEVGVLGRGGFGSEGIEGAGLVRVLQRKIDPVEELGGLVDGRGAGVDG